MIQITQFQRKKQHKKTYKVNYLNSSLNLNNLKEMDRKAKESLFYNRVGAPSRPLRSLEDMIAFLSGS